MKRLVCFMISVILFFYGGCYIKKNGLDELPTKSEFVEYLGEKKDTTIATYYMVKEWIVNTFDIEIKEG